LGHILSGYCFPSTPFVASVAASPHKHTVWPLQTALVS
jgi:hypothetical protein